MKSANRLISRQRPCGDVSCLRRRLHEIGIEHQPFLARQRDKPFAARAPDQRQVRLPRQLDAPRGETRARHQNRDAHLHRLDHHLGGEAARRVEYLVVRR